MHRFRRADGVYRWHLSRAHAMRDATGAISMWIGSNTDIHEEKEREEELRRANEDLNQFAFAASHDFQEPLRMITSYSQLLLKGYRGQLDGEASVCVDFISEGTKRMRELLADLLSYTEAGSNQPEADELIDLNLIFQKASQNLKTAIEESGATLTSDPLPTSPGQAGAFRAVVPEPDRQRDKVPWREFSPGSFRCRKQTRAIGSFPCLTTAWGLIRSITNRFSEYLNGYMERRSPEPASA